MDPIKRVEQTARLLEPDAAQQEILFHQITRYAQDYLASIADAPAYAARPDNGRALLDAPITEEGIDLAEALALLHDNVETVGINPTSGRFLGYIPGGGLLHSALGDLLAALSNRYASVFYAGPGAVRIENMLIRWMASIVGYPQASAGYLASGGSLASLTAIVTAREACGLEDDAIRRAVVYQTEHTHHCIDKALRVAGLGRCIRRTVPVDAHYRMVPEALDTAIASDRKAGLHPWLVVASAGTTNTGSVDPLPEIGDIAQAHGLWFHVDGAYGAFFILCPEGQAILRGMDQSDSLVLDPHKTLFLPYGTGALLVKDSQKLYDSHKAGADYMQDTLDAVEELSPANLSPELTKHFRGLRLWLPLKVLGLAPFRAALSEKILLARYFYERLQHIDGFEVGPYPDLSVVTYRYVPPRGDVNTFNQRLVKSIQQDGRIFISSTRIGGHFMLRLAVGCFRTHLDDIDTALDVLQRTAEHLACT
ncbi:MAG: pyridoxal phosphate-dependent decarboxylase family protein [Rhodothermales bacterium]